MPTSSEPQRSPSVAEPADLRVYVREAECHRHGVVGYMEGRDSDDSFWCPVCERVYRFRVEVVR